MPYGVLSFFYVVPHALSKSLREPYTLRSPLQPTPYQKRVDERAPVVYSPSHDPLTQGGLRSLYQKVETSCQLNGAGR